MNIDVKDIKSLSIKLSAPGSGDTADLTLSNPDGKYNYLLSQENRLREIYRFYGGYDSSQVVIFTGKCFTTELQNEPNDLKVSFSERNAILERAVMDSEYIRNKSVRDILVDCAIKYLGYSSDEVEVDNSFNTIIDVFQVNQTSLLRKLRELASAFGGLLFNDANGHFCCINLFNKYSPDITYDEDQGLSYSFHLTGIYDRITTFKVIGREKTLSDVVNTEVEQCVAFTQTNPVYVISPLDVSYRKSKFRTQFFKAKKGENIEIGLGDPSILFQGEPGRFYTSEGKIDEEDFNILELTNEEPNIPTSVDTRKFTPGSTSSVKENWQIINLNPEILGFDEQKTFIRMNSGKDQDTTKILACLFGNPIQSKYIIEKGFKIEDWKISPVYEETKSPDALNYYAKAFWVMPGTGVRLSELLGSENTQVYELDFISSDEMAFQCLVNLSNIEFLKQHRFEVKVPFNPLIERGDIVRVNRVGEKKVIFYVIEIEHNFGSGVATTTLKGYIKNVEDEPWL